MDTLDTTNYLDNSVRQWEWQIPPQIPSWKYYSWHSKTGHWNGDENGTDEDHDTAGDWSDLVNGEEY